MLSLKLINIEQSLCNREICMVPLGHPILFEGRRDSGEYQYAGLKMEATVYIYNLAICGAS